VDNLANQKAMLLAAKTELDTARTGFVRLGHILTAIQTLADGSDTTIANLAEVGAALADEFSDEAQASASEYARLIDNLGNLHA
jgi:hypothetical protein